jgi:hypothetical protein
MKNKQRAGPVVARPPGQPPAARNLIPPLPKPKPRPPRECNGNGNPFRCQNQNQNQNQNQPPQRPDTAARGAVAVAAVRWRGTVGGVAATASWRPG